MENEMIRLLESATQELEKLLSTKTVIGAPIEIQGRTIVPLVSVGFGMGVGGGRGSDRKTGEGGGAGLAIAGGAKPIALIIADDSGVRLEVVKGGGASAAEHIAEIVAKALEKRQNSDPNPGA